MTMKLLHFIWQHPLLLVCYGIQLFESVLHALFPAILGMAVDEMIRDRRVNGFTYLTLIIGMSRIVVYYISMRTNNVVFARLQAKMAFEVGSRYLLTDGDVSKAQGRAFLVRRLSQFLENTIPRLIMAVVGLTGALVALFTYGWHVAIINVGIIGLSWFMFRWLIAQVQVFAAQRHDLIEQEVDQFKAAKETGDHEKLKGFISTMAEVAIKWTKADALVWLGVAGLNRAAAVVSVVMIILGDGTAGMAMAAYKYSDGMGHDLDRINSTVQDYSQTGDVLKRCEL